MEAGNKRQRGPLGRKAWGARRWMPASTARARRACVCARSRWCRRDAGGLSCVCGPESVLHSPSMRYCGARGQTCAGGCALLLRRGRWRPLWALGRVCTTQPGVSCGVCHKCRASAEARRRSGCVGGIARGIEALRVHGVGRRGGVTRRCVLVCATQPGAGCGAQFCEEREPWGRWSWVRGGGGGAAGSCAGGGLHGCASPCVCVIAGLRPRGSERAHRGCGCALG